MAGVVLQTRITAILDGLTKAAVAEIEQLIEDDSAVFNREIQRREEEIESLKKRLHITEKELLKVQAIVLTSADRCSVGVQVKMVDTDLMGCEKEPLTVNPVQTFNTRLAPELKEEKPVPRSHDETDLTKASHVHGPDSRRPRARHEEEFNSLEFEMKIEQVEELVDQELNLPNADYSMAEPNASAERKTASQRDPQLWSSLEDVTNEFSVPDGCMALEHYEQISTDQCMVSTLNCHGDNIANKLVDAFGPAHVSVDRDMHFDGGVTKVPEYGQLRDTLGHMSLQRLPNSNGKQRHTFGTVSQPHAQLSIGSFRLPGMPPVRESALTSHVGSKPFRCEECGKRFTQRTRLITHKRIHTGEKPYHCQLCGKMFSRQDNCLRHVRLHSGQRL